MNTPKLIATAIAMMLMHIPEAVAAADTEYVSKVWVADCGDGTYRNPVINADYSDPDVVAVDGDYYMTASSFCNVPGLPILHSRDLVNWTIVNYALKELVPADFYSKPQHGRGVWAPSIRHHEGMYYIFWGDPDFGIFMVKTSDPRGEWSKPVLVKEGKGMIDTTPLWDDNGRAYLVNAWAASRAGMNSIITVTEMKPDGTELIGDPVLVFDGNDGTNHTIEGPKFYKRNNYYYIFAPAGGVANGWQLVMRSRSPFGPYEPRIAMAQGSTDINGPHQGGWVDTPEGESWFIHFQDKDLYGRVVHLNPMKWVDDWAVIGIDNDGDGCGEPVTRHKKPHTTTATTIATPQESDEFNSRQLGLQWQWHANYRPEFGFTSDLGFMRLYGHELSEEYVNFWEVPNLLTQKFPSDSFTATADVKISAKADGQQSGIIVMGRDYCRLSIEKSGENFVIKQITCKDAENGTTEQSTVIDTVAPTNAYKAGAHPNYELSVSLRVKVDKGGLCHFYYSIGNGRFKMCGKPFQAREGKWIGARVGFFSVEPHGVSRGWMDIDRFEITR